MPTAEQLISNVRSLALIGASGASVDQTRVEAYFNMAYREVYEMVAERYPWFVQATQNVVITAGTGTLDPQPLHILSVIDTGNNYAKLRPTDILAIEDEDPELAATGNPDRFHVNGFNAFCTWPLNSTTLRVRYTPNAAVLTTESAEADIKLQPIHHDVLVWGTLRLMAYDERDKVVGAELAYNDKAHNEALDRMWRWFDAHAPQEEKRVESYVM